MDAQVLLKNHTSSIKFEERPNNYPDSIGRACLGNIECCYFEDHYRNAPKGGGPEDCVFELLTLKIPSGFQLRTYTVENGSVTLGTSGTEMDEKGFKKPLLFNIKQGSQTDPHEHPCHNKTLFCAGRNGCPTPGTRAGEFILYSKNYSIPAADGESDDIVPFYFFLFVYHTQEIIFHVVSELEIVELIKKWDALLKLWIPQPDEKILMLKLDGVVDYDDELEILTTTGAHNILIMVNRPIPDTTTPPSTPDDF